MGPGSTQRASRENPMTGSKITELLAKVWRQGVQKAVRSLNSLPNNSVWNPGKIHPGSFPVSVGLQHLPPSESLGVKSQYRHPGWQQDRL